MPTLRVAAVRRVPFLAILLAVPLAAQIPVGTTFRTTPSVASRGALNGLPGLVLTRFDRDDLRGFGMTTPGTHVITGVRVALQDYNGATPESFTVELYTEGPNPSFPRLGSPIAVSSLVTLPGGGTGAVDYDQTVNFANPVNVPAGGDVFIGIRLQSAPSWPFDGLAVQTILGHSSRWPTYDKPGPAAIQSGGYGLFDDGTGLVAYNTTRQLVADLLTPTPGGAVLAITNQTNYPISNGAPGSGGLLSALHPDATATPLTPGRADDSGFAFLDSSLPNGTLVFFFGDFTTFGPETSLQGIAAGSRGVFCLQFATMTTFAILFTANGTAQLNHTIPASLRGSLGGVSFLQQAIAVDLQGILHASPCYRAQF